MDAQEQFRQAINTAFLPIHQYNQAGTLLDIRSLDEEKIKQVCFQPLPDAAWFVRIHVIFPHEHYVNAVVASRNGEMKNECHLGYDLFPESKDESVEPLG